MARSSLIRVTGMVDGALVDAVASDVSSNEMQLLSARPAAVGARMSLVALVDGEMIEAEGAVRSSSRHESGLHLVAVRLDRSF